MGKSQSQLYQKIETKICLTHLAIPATRRRSGNGFLALNTSTLSSRPMRILSPHQTHYIKIIRKLFFIT